MSTEAKVVRMQRGREIQVYPWAIEAAEAVQECTIFTRMVWPDTDLTLYLAELITDAADGKLREAA